MNLPVGVYAVSAEFAEKSGVVTFTFKNTQYSGQIGVNVFAYLEEMAQAPLEKPEKPFCGYGDTPVVIMPAGVYKIGSKPYMKFRTYMPCAITILGENAGISPNGPDLRTGNSQWGKETVIMGNFYYGCIAMEGSVPGTLTLDGLVLQTTKVFDERKQGTGHGLVIKNCSFTGYQIRDLILTEPLQDPEATRFTLLQDIRADGIDSLNGEGQLVKLGCGDLTVERLYFANNEKFFSLTDYGHKALCCRSGESSKILYKDSLFENCQSPCGFSIQLPEDAGDVTVQIDNCAFSHVTPKGDSVICMHLPHSGCSLQVTNCTFTGSDGIPAIRVGGDPGAKVDLTGTVQTGFSDLLGSIPPRRTQVNPLPWQDVGDPHRAVAADFTPLELLYEGRMALHGDFHTHTDSGGSSDGKTPLAEFVQQLKDLDLDFAAVVDHRQMRHFFLPEWDESMLICGTEPSTSLQGTNARYRSMDYTMIFPDKEGLGKVMENFPEFQYSGGIDGRYVYPQFQKQRLMELGEYVWSIGGLMSHAHPKQLMASSDPLDYYLGEQVAIETVHGDVNAFASKQNRDLWVSLLQLGKRVTTHGSSDTHSEAKNTALTTVYTKSKHSTDIFNHIRSGDCSAGAWGIQMTIDGCAMGNSIPYKEGQSLLVSVGDAYPDSWQPDTVYCLKVYTDQGLAYAQEIDGQMFAQLALQVKKRKYYRVEITNESDHTLVALGNPIWLDYDEKEGKTS